MTVEHAEKEVSHSSRDAEFKPVLSYNQPTYAASYTAQIGGFFFGTRDHHDPHLKSPGLCITLLSLPGSYSRTHNTFSENAVPTATSDAVTSSDMFKFNKWGSGPVFQFGLPRGWRVREGECTLSTTYKSRSKVNLGCWRGLS